jgi:transcriptional regulator with XRE-family HTH domain
MRLNIEAERGRKQLSKEGLCRILGITSATYQKYIHGSAIPSNILEAMAKLFDCTIEYLLERDGTDEED